MPIGICYYCSKERPLIDAHIIPKGFLGDVSEKGFLEASTEYAHTKKRRKGPYDQNILCKECDAFIGLYDQYAKSLMIDDILGFRDPSNPVYIIRTDRYDYVKLKKFFISLIWRADISTLGLYETVSLGPMRDIALAHLNGSKPITDESFAVIVFKDAPHLKYQDAITLVASRLAGKKAYKLHFSGYQVTIVPNAIGMKWNLSGGEVDTKLMFLKRDSGFLILEVNDDVSGKDTVLQKVYRGRMKAEKL